MKVRFENDCTLVIMPKDSVEAMALKYWAAEYEKHGDKVLHVATDVPMTLPDHRQD